MGLLTINELAGLGWRWPWEESPEETARVARVIERDRQLRIRKILEARRRGERPSYASGYYTPDVVTMVQEGVIKPSWHGGRATPHPLLHSSASAINEHILQRQARVEAAHRRRMAEREWARRAAARRTAGRKAPQASLDARFRARAAVMRGTLDRSQREARRRAATKARYATEARLATRSYHALLERQRVARRRAAPPLPPLPPLPPPLAERRKSAARSALFFSPRPTTGGGVTYGQPVVRGLYQMPRRGVVVGGASAHSPQQSYYSSPP
jgi:hypothetical protein